MAYAYTYLKGYFSALGIKVILDIMLSETSQTQKAMCCMIPHKLYVTNGQICRDR